MPPAPLIVVQVQLVRGAWFEMRGAWCGVRDWETCLGSDLYAGARVKADSPSLFNNQTLFDY